MPIVTLNSPPFPYYLECGRAVYGPGEQHPNRTRLGVFDWIFVQSGCLHIGEEKVAWELKEGQALILLPDHYHYAVKPCEEQTSFYWVHFHTVAAWRYGEAEPSYADSEQHQRTYLAYPYEIGLPQFTVLPDPISVFAQLERLCSLATERRSSSVWEQQQVLEGLMRSMDIRRNVDASGPAVNLAERTEAFLRSNYRQRITSGLLSESLHFHYNYIARCMKLVYGLSPMDYLLQYRLEQAKTALLITDRPISEIAAQAGFDNAPYFTRLFSERIGMPPLQYRKRHSP